MVKADKIWTKDEIWDVLKNIPDPEIPVISIVELGIARDVNLVDNKTVEVIITPTYSGCPAMDAIETDIKAELTRLGFTEVTVKLVYSPAWTTDWMSEEGKRKMREYGISTPEKTCGGVAPPLEDAIVICPQCKSKNTRLISQFGSTSCKALYQCNDCKEPFDHFKCL